MQFEATHQDVLVIICFKNIKRGKQISDFAHITFDRIN